MDPDETDLADDDLRDERSREDHEADEADRKLKIEREDGRRRPSPEAEALAAYERDRRLFGAS
jgi:hypothetical protein